VFVFVLLKVNEIFSSDDFLYIFGLFQCDDVKNKFFKKYIILIYFQVKNNLKRNRYHNTKYYLILVINKELRMLHKKEFKML
jgi:hypothetical protein